MGDLFAWRCGYEVTVIILVNQTRDIGIGSCVIQGFGQGADGDFPLADHADIRAQDMHGDLGIRTDDSASHHADDAGIDASRDVNDFLYLVAVPAETARADDIDVMFAQQSFQN